MVANDAHFNPKHVAIWRVTQLIPVGKVATYGQVADLAGLPGRARMVGKVLGMVPSTGWQGANVPWYRVINSQGKISLPVGSDSFEQQRQSLLEEGVIVKNGRIALKTFQWQPALSELLYELNY
ncbi:MGMT family protein [Thalassotalea fusca]